MCGSGNPGSDIELFSIFENRHYAADQVYFYESNSKNRRIWPCIHSKVFTFTGTLKMNIFLTICKYLPFTSKIKFKIKICFNTCIYFFFPKMFKTGCDIIIYFLFIFSEIFLNFVISLIQPI